MDRRYMTWAILALGVLILLANTLFIVEQRQQAIVVRFGEPVRVINAPSRPAPGLKIKAPFIENVIKFDKRNIALESAQEEIIAADQERLVVDAFIRYRIADPLQFYRTLRDERTANDRIERLVNSSLRQVLGTATSNDIISGRRGQLMQLTKTDVSNRAKVSRFGIEIIDVRIKRADLPQANSASVFNRMKTDREREAGQLRAEGDEENQRIKATADREVAVIRADAGLKAQFTMGEADGEAAKIYADAFNRDRDFYAFYRRLEGYRKAFGAGGSTMVLSPDSDFFRYFESGVAPKK